MTNENSKLDMDAGLDQMRRDGLSIDGDNAYKRDLMDAITGALAFGKQRSTPPPAGHWLERFYEIGKAEADERDALRASLPVGVPDGIAEQHAKAMRLLREAHSWIIPKGNISVSIFERIGAFLDSAAAPAAPTVKAEQVPCATCQGSSMVDDGEITCSEGGIPYENGPVKCVKDCPDCTVRSPSLPAAGSAVEEVGSHNISHALRERLLGQLAGDHEPEEMLCVEDFYSWLAKAIDNIRAEYRKAEGSKPVQVYASTALSAQQSAPAYGSYTTRPAEAVAGIALRQLGDESRWVEIRDLNAHAFPDIGPHDYYPVGTVLRMPAEQHSAPERVSVPDTARLDFMLQERRKVVVERLPHDNFEVYVEEGLMGDKRYPGVRYSGEWEQGETEALEIQREAIDAALLASHGRGEA